MSGILRVIVKARTFFTSPIALQCLSSQRFVRILEEWKSNQPPSDGGVHRLELSKRISDPEQCQAILYNRHEKIPLVQLHKKIPFYQEVDEDLSAKLSEE